MFVTFIDYRAAFDSVGHKFLDRALQRDGASAKTRAIFRSIYTATNARTVVNGSDGETLYSQSFPVLRGVVQGDITFPIYDIFYPYIRTNTGIA